MTYWKSRAEAAEARERKLRSLIAEAVNQEERDTVSHQARHSMWRKLRRAALAQQPDDHPAVSNEEAYKRALLYGRGTYMETGDRPAQHDLYKTGDPDAPRDIKDNNGEVVLGLCRRCNRGEIELREPCDQPVEIIREDVARGDT